MTFEKKDDAPESSKEISAFIHCKQCLEEVKAADWKFSPAEHARFEIGWSARGMQVWCRRHDINVIHVDFEGRRHPANVTASVIHDLSKM